MTIEKIWREMPFSGVVIGRKLMAVCAVATMVAAGSATMMSQTAAREPHHPGVECQYGLKRKDRW